MLERDLGVTARSKNLSYHHGNINIQNQNVAFRESSLMMTTATESHWRRIISTLRIFKGSFLILRSINNDFLFPSAQSLKERLNRNVTNCGGGWRQRAETGRQWEDCTHRRGRFKDRGPSLCMNIHATTHICVFLPIFQGGCFSVEGGASERVWMRASCKTSG